MCDLETDDLEASVSREPRADVSKTSNTHCHSTPWPEISFHILIMAQATKVSLFLASRENGRFDFLQAHKSAVMCKERILTTCLSCGSSSKCYMVEQGKAWWIETRLERHLTQKRQLTKKVGTFKILQNLERDQYLEVFTTTILDKELLQFLPH